MDSRLLRRVKRVFTRVALRFISSKVDRLRPTYGANVAGPRLLALPIGPLVPSGREAEDIDALARRCLAHQFDLLGSGPVHVRYDMACSGVEGHQYSPPVVSASLDRRINRANLMQSRAVHAMIGKDYVPIDWQRDFKSGYRWSERTGYRNIAFGTLPGVDIKVPWELARMQHLPQLGLAFALASNSARVACQDEFRNQLLDFIANNPPRFGVNWMISMEVAIRVVSWLVAYSLFKAHGASFDSAFENVLACSVHAHAVHIVRNLEWTDGIRGNHYLANIAGLLFAAACLPQTGETDAWLAFAVRQLILEVREQFGADGANFEASTSYHRLSAEMVVMSTALVLGLPVDRQRALECYDSSLLKVGPGLAPAPIPMHLRGDRKSPFPDWYVARLERMAEFTAHITKPDGSVPQIGDNDSGYFLKLCPPLLRLSREEAVTRYANLAMGEGQSAMDGFLVEDHLDHRQLVGAINALFRRDDLRVFSGHSIAVEFAAALADGARLGSYRTGTQKSGAEEARVGATNTFDSFRPDAVSRSDIRIPIPGESIREDLELFAYPDFGLYLFRSRRLYLAFRCGPVGQNGNGGHAHNDQLAIELSVDGVNWIVDPGTYLYTPLPVRRNEYRSARAHFVPQFEGREPARLDLHIFKLEDSARARCLYFGDQGIIGSHEGFGFPVWRVVRIGPNAVHVVDHYAAHVALAEAVELRRESVPKGPDFSPGYGILCRRAHTK